jgi:hypothetical protein
MDVTKVPRTARSTLGLFIHEFTFEREVVVEEGERTLKSGIKVGEKDHQPFPKKLKPTNQSTPRSTNQGDRFGGKFSIMEARNNSPSQTKKWWSLFLPNWTVGTLEETK